MPSRHTAENLAAKLIDAVETWGINGKVSACVHDNAHIYQVLSSLYHFERSLLN